MTRRALIPTRFTLTIALLCAATPLAAQTPAAPAESRAQQAATQRDGKAETLTPPRRSPIERALHWYDVNGARVQWRVFHLSGGSFPGGAGFGYGIGATQQAIGAPGVDPKAPNRIDGDTFFARSVRGYQRGSARIDVLNVGAVPIDVMVRAQNYQLTQEDFYGTGPDSQESDRTNYRVDGEEYQAGVAWRPSARWRLGSEVFYMTPDIKAGTDRAYPITQSRHPDLPGLTGLPKFLMADGSLSFDWRDSDTHPRRGGEYRATLSQYTGDDDGAFDFRRLDIGVQQIIPIFDAYRRIELRGGASFTDAAAGAAVPFIYQPTLGGASTLRGYAGRRFRDQNAAWARAEYQWESWWAMDAAIFIDAGQVAPDRHAFDFDKVKIDYGVGFRVHSNSKFLAKLDLAYGREGFMPSFGFNYGF